MFRKIQFHTFHLLFRLFSYLADKSGGWNMFVRPKLVIGALIVGLGITACDKKSKSDTQYDNPKIKKNILDSIDSISRVKPIPHTVMCYFIPPVIKGDDEEADTAQTDSLNKDAKPDSLIQDTIIQKDTTQNP